MSCQEVVEDVGWLGRREPTEDEPELKWFFGAAINTVGIIEVAIRDSWNWSTAGFRGHWGDETDHLLCVDLSAYKY